MRASKKISYSEDVDILMIQLSDKKIDDAYETDRMIVHVDRNDEPVLLEIFNGKQYIKELGKTLPRAIKSQIFVQPHPVTTHQIRK